MAACLLGLLICASDLAAGLHQNANPSPAADHPQPSMPGFLHRPIPSVRHLPEWLAEHENLPVQQQILLLRRNPGFQRLAPQAQQQLMNQLVRINQMPPRQRQRYLARNEAIEHLTPAQRAAFNQAVHAFAQLSPQQRAAMTQAFRRLRRYPMNQRPALLDAQPYQSLLAPPQRVMLGNLLLAEPYLPAQQKQPTPR